MRPLQSRRPDQIERGHAYRRLAILKVASPLVSAVVAASAAKALAVEELEAMVAQLARRADQIAGQVAVAHLERLDHESRERIRRQIAQDVAYLLAREHVRTRRNPDAQVTDATLAHILELAQRHFETLPGASEQPRYNRPLARQTELDLAWMRAIARVAESAWTRPVVWSNEALADADPDALVERCGVHLSAAVTRGTSLVYGLGERCTEEQLEIVTTVRLSLLGQLSRGYARILDAHTPRERFAQTLEQRLTGFVEVLLRYAQQHFEPRLAAEPQATQVLSAPPFSVEPFRTIASLAEVQTEPTHSFSLEGVEPRQREAADQPTSNSPFVLEWVPAIQSSESNAVLMSGAPMALELAPGPFRISV
jgi:hypothetical protein